MTIKECIDIVDNIKPNQYSIRDKVMWLSFIDEIIINEVLQTHEGYDGRYDSFEGYSEDKLSVPLIVPSPYDRLYTAYLKMRIDGENGETARYNNSMAMYNTYMLEFRKHYNKTHMPISTTDRRVTIPQAKPSVGLSDAEYENLKKDMTFILTEYFSGAVSADKLSAIVNEFVQNNIEMLKGRDGYTPKKGVDYFTEAEINDIKVSAKGDKGDDGKPGKDGYVPVKGVDYWTPEDKSDVKKYINEQAAIIKADVEGLQAQINEEAHFRGYMSTNAKIHALEATPNDFAYSAESGTKLIYDAEYGWKDSFTPVPDQLTPASTATPLMDDIPTAGESEEYARGDHRHPTDITRVGVSEFNTFKGDLETALDNIIAIQNSLIGGGSV
jgi:hypothetical protein